MSKKKPANSALFLPFALSLLIPHDYFLTQYSLHVYGLLCNHE